MLGNNQLVIRVQPDEGVMLKFGSKVPGTTMEVRDIAMDFQYGEAFTESSPEAYERLVLDVLIGDRTLFPDAAEVEASWRVDRPAGGGLGRHQAGAVPRRRVGSARRRRDAGPRAAGAWRRTSMIALWDTTGNEVVKALAAERRSAGGVASGLALTLVVVVDEKRVREAEAAATIAAAAHPCRLLIVVRVRRRAADAVRLDAEIVVGGRLGPCEAVVMRMYGRLALHAESVVMPLLAPGRAGGDLVARRRRRSGSPTTRSAWSPTAGSPTCAQAADPIAALRQRADDYAPGDTDLAWTRITPWRTLVAGAFDTTDDRVVGATVVAPPTDPTAALLGGWLARRLGVTPRWEPTTEYPRHARVSADAAPTATSSALTRDDGTAMFQPHRPARPACCRWSRRPLGDELAEELRRLDPDQPYAAALAAATGRDRPRRPARRRGCTSGTTRRWPSARRRDRGVDRGVVTR